MNLFYLLRARLWSIRNTLLSRRSIGITLTWALIVVVLSIGLYQLSCRLFLKVDQVDQISSVLATIQSVSALLDNRAPTIGEMLNRTLLMMFLFSLMIMLLISNVITALSTFFSSEELDLIFSSPLSYRSLFCSKFVETAIQSSWMVFIVLVPFLAALGRVYRAPTWFYFVAWVPLVPFVVYCTATGIIITLLLAKVFPVSQTRNLLRFLAVLGAGAVLIIFRVMRPELLVAPDHFREFLVMLNTPWNPHLENIPSGWAVKEILWMMDFPLSALWYDHLLLWLGAAVCLVITYRFCSRLHLACWQVHLEISDESVGPMIRSGSLTEVKESLLDRLLSPLGIAGRSILSKDVRVFCRSPVIWTQIMLMVVIMIIYLYNVHLLPLKTMHGVSPVFLEWLAFLNIGFVAFVVVALGLRFGFPAISLEGQGFFLIHNSPVGIDRYFMIKFWSNFVPLNGISLTLVLVSDYILGVRSWVFWLSILDVALLTYMIAALALGFGAFYHDFKRQSLSEIPSSFGGMVFMVTTLSSVVLVMLLQALPFWYYTELALSIAKPKPWHYWLGLVCLLCSIGLCLALARLALSWGIRSLRYLEVS